MKNIEKLKKIINSAGSGMLVTLGTKPMARPMQVVKDDDLYNIRFLTVLQSNKVKEIQKNENVFLTFSDHSSHSYASVEGEAEVILDRNHIEKYYSKIFDPFFTEGIDTSGLCLISIQINHAECWYNDKNFILEAIEFAKGFPNGTKAKLNERFAVNL